MIKKIVKYLEIVHQNIGPVNAYIPPLNTMNDIDQNF